MLRAVERQIPRWKIEEVEKLAQLLREHRVIGVASLYKLRAPQLQELRKRFRGQLLLRVAKKTLMQRALKMVEDEKPGISRLAERMEGPVIFLFTNMSPFKLSLMLEKSKVKTFAKMGDVAPEDIVVPAGNTGIAPGPVISEFHEVGLPTKIEGGSIWITRDYVIVKRGEVIDHKVASVLARLGIKPIEVGLTLSAAYEDGVVFSKEHLMVKPEEVASQLREGSQRALSLAISISYPSPQTMPLLIAKAVANARALAIAASYPSPKTIRDLIAIAQSQAAALASRISLIGREAAPPKLEERVEEKPPKGEVEEVGLSALFG